ncbi:hypothetical protein B566_EDAN004480 [Ephemera danica]|nr:hypothetical protein B566_EDAN004480 [Ephemera danica]
MERFCSAPDEERHGSFLRDVTELLLRDAVFAGTSRTQPLVHWSSPDELKKIVDMELHEAPSSHDELLEAIKKTIKYSVKTGHPMFLNQLFSGLDPYGLAGQWVTDALNPSGYTFEVSPVFTVLEDVVMTRMRELVGYPEGRGDGTDGLHGLPRLVLFASEDAHYSVHKMAALQGLGENSVRSVPVDAEGRMDVEALERDVLKSREEGARPFLVMATAVQGVVTRQVYLGRCSGDPLRSLTGAAPRMPDTTTADWLGN